MSSWISPQKKRECQSSECEEWEEKVYFINVCEHGLKFSVWSQFTTDFDELSIMNWKYCDHDRGEYKIERWLWEAVGVGCEDMNLKMFNFILKSFNI